MIVAELFSKQCKPWQNLVHDLFERILSSAYATVIAVLRYGVDDQTAGSLVCEIIGLFMERLKAELSMKVDELLKPHLFGHHITCNHRLIENVQRHRLLVIDVRWRNSLKPF